MAGPVIRKTNTAQRVRKLRALITKFQENMESMAKRMVMPKGVLERISWDAPDEKALVELRRLLVSYIKSGMLERKDQELEIAVVAMMVWFQRQDRERMFSILESWGT